jgi:hypothetical protein
MVSSYEDDQSVEVTQSQVEQQYTSSQEVEVESYPRLLSNQTSDVLDVMDESSTEVQYMDGQQYSQDSYGQGDTGTVA